MSRLPARSNVPSQTSDSGLRPRTFHLTPCSLDLYTWTFNLAFDLCLLTFDFRISETRDVRKTRGAGIDLVIAIEEKAGRIPGAGRKRVAHVGRQRNGTAEAVRFAGA